MKKADYEGHSQQMVCCLPFEVVNTQLSGVAIEKIYPNYTQQIDTGNRKK